MRSYTVVCHWEGADQYEMNADEIVVSADSPAEAAWKATKKWRQSFGIDWPHLKLVGTEIVKPRPNSAHPDNRAVAPPN